MLNNQITGIILVAIGAVDVFFGYKKMTSGFGKFLNAFNKVEDVTLVLLIGGVILCVLGVLKLIDKN